jgi:methionyl-tRNA formyltransferase
VKRDVRIGLLGTLNAFYLGYILRELLERGIAVDAILLDSKLESEHDQRTHEERTAGRMPPVPLESFANQAPPCFFIDNHNSQTTVRLVQQLGLDLLLNAGTPRILDAAILGAPSVGVLNCHPGLLPRFRGCTCVEWALFLDELVGVTVHLMSEGIDEGPVLTQRAVPVNRGDRWQDVRVKVHHAANRLLAEAVRGLIDGTFSPVDFQPQGQGRYFPVIEAEKMAALKKKLDYGEYAHFVD